MNLLNKVFTYIIFLSLFSVQNIICSHYFINFYIISNREEFKTVTDRVKDEIIAEFYPFNIDKYYGKEELTNFNETDKTVLYTAKIKSKYFNKIQKNQLTDEDNELRRNQRPEAFFQMTLSPELFEELQEENSSCCTIS